MEPQDDPEARIRDLERPLSDVARNSELGVDGHGGAYGYPPPPTPPPPTTPTPTAPWGHQYPTMSPMSDAGHSRAYVIPVVIAVLAFVIAGGVSVYLLTKSEPSSSGDRSQIAGGGATLSDWPADRPSTGGGKTLLPPQGPAAPDRPPIGPGAPPSGATVTVSGIGENKTITCNESILSISGIENTVTVIGHCASLSVSGVDNVVTVDSANSIGVSGFDNRIEFHTGEPEVSNSGSGNTVSRG